MPHQIDFRSPSAFPADRFFATMVDAEFLRTRLQRMGGPGAALLEHTADTDGARYRLRHGIDKSNLPPLVQSLVPGNLVIERTEALRRVGPGAYDGDVNVTVPGTPVSAVGRMNLNDVPNGSEFVVHADVTVNVPLFGGRIEETIAEQVRNLLIAETEFTQQWMRDHAV